MTGSEFTENLKKDPQLLLEVLFTSSPQEHANLMRRYGREVNTSVEDLIDKFGTLNTNESYINDMQNIEVVYSNLPDGYEQALTELGILPVIEVAPETKGVTTGTKGTDEESTTTESKKFNWGAVGKLFGGVLVGYAGSQGRPITYQQAPKTNPNTIFYIVGAVALLVLGLFVMKKK